MPSKKKMEYERTESLWRVLIAIVSGIILEIWMIFNLILGLANVIFTLITGERKRDISELCEIGNTQLYVFARYVTGMSKQRPFPFGKLQKNMSTFEK